MNKPEQSKELKVLQKLRKLITTLWGCPHTEHVRAQAEALQIVVSLIAGLDSRPAEVRLSISDAKIAKQALELYDDIEINGLNVGMDFWRVAATLTRQLDQQSSKKVEKCKTCDGTGEIVVSNKTLGSAISRCPDCQLDAGKGER